ncbi:MAG: hypothetical protein NVS4B2_23210 [Chloroflexota bacterium]
MQALLAARHCRRVVATDINGRALALCRLNAKLNSIDNVEVREGSWFEPVLEERFDLVVSNPPYVIAPESRFLYRDNELGGDELCRLLVRQASSHLKPGGVAQIACNWILEPGLAWFDRPASWSPSSECDILVLRSRSYDAAAYAAACTPHGDDTKELERVLDYLNQTGIAAVADGAVTIRAGRNGADHWLLALDGAGGPGRLGGAHVAGIFAGQDQSQKLREDDVLLDTRFRPVDGQRLDQVLTYTQAHGYRPGNASMRFASGLPVTVELDPHVMRIAVACDGKSSLRDLIDEVAKQLEVDPEWLRTITLAQFRDSVGLGLLVPV